MPGVACLIHLGAKMVETPSEDMNIYIEVQVLDNQVSRRICQAQYPGHSGAEVTHVPICSLYGL